MKYFLTIIILLSGCNTHTHIKKTTFIPPKRCKTLFSARGKYSVVIIQKDYIKKGITSIGIIISHTKDGKKLAAKESFYLITNYLQFKPTLALFTMGKIKNKPFYLMLITGASP